MFFCTQGVEIMVGQRLLPAWFHLMSVQNSVGCGHFFLLEYRKRVCLRYLERVTRSESDKDKRLYSFLDISTTSLCSFLTLPIKCVPNDIQSSVCNRILMVIHWIHVVQLLSAVSNTKKNICTCKPVLL